MLGVEELRYGSGNRVAIYGSKRWLFIAVYRVTDNMSRDKEKSYYYAGEISDIHYSELRFVKGNPCRL